MRKFKSLYKFKSKAQEIGGYYHADFSKNRRCNETKCYFEWNCGFD